MVQALGICLSWSLSAAEVSKVFLWRAHVFGSMGMPVSAFMDNISACQVSRTAHLLSAPLLVLWLCKVAIVVVGLMKAVDYCPTCFLRVGSHCNFVSMCKQIITHVFIHACISIT